MKSKKSKKQETIRSDLAHILGYTGTDMDPVGPPSPVGSEKEAAGRLQKHVMQYSLHCPTPITVHQACAAHSSKCAHLQNTHMAGVCMHKHPVATLLVLQQQYSDQLPRSKAGDLSWIDWVARQSAAAHS